MERLRSCMVLAALCGGCVQPEPGPSCDGIDPFGDQAITREWSVGRLDVFLSPYTTCDFPSCSGGYPSGNHTIVQLDEGARHPGVYQLGHTDDVRVECGSCIPASDGTEDCEGDDGFALAGTVEILAIDGGTVEGCFDTAHCGAFRFEARPCTP